MQDHNSFALGKFAHLLAVVAENVPSRRLWNEAVIVTGSGGAVLRMSWEDAGDIIITYDKGKKMEARIEFSATFPIHRSGTLAEQFTTLGIEHVADLVYYELYETEVKHDD